MHEQITKEFEGRKYLYECTPFGYVSLCVMLIMCFPWFLPYALYNWPPCNQCYNSLTLQMTILFHNWKACRNCSFGS